MADTKVSVDIHRPEITARNHEGGHSLEPFSVIRVTGRVAVFFQQDEIEKLVTLRDAADAAIEFLEGKQLAEIYREDEPREALPLHAGDTPARLVRPGPQLVHNSNA